jgi:uncharacterized OsmC-like protein
MIMAPPSGEQTLMQYIIEATLDQRGQARASCREASIEFDTSVGQSASQMGPADLLATAFAACVLKNVERFAHLLPFTYRTASIRVTLERQDHPPRITSVQYALRLVTPESPHRVDLLQRNLIKYGTIYNTLAAACSVTGTIIAEPPDTSASSGDNDPGAQIGHTSSPASFLPSASNVSDSSSER